jgi:hypothetical protein
MLTLLLLLPLADAAPYAAEARSHWAFQPLRRPAVPPAGPWARTPIDAFLLARAGTLTPTPQADHHTLVRRLCLNLTGLPPTADDLDLTYDRLVEKLLASPAFGERFGRLWLDLARYADTNGYERDGDKPLAWKYRDWVIDALNRKLPYDRFLAEQIAGDELPDADVSSRTATTFLRLGTWDDEPANVAVDRYEQLDDVLGTTSAVFLAQTVRCARCHDHKFEPIAQKDYYRLLAIFEPLVRPQNGREDLTYPVGNRAEMEAYRAAADRKEADRRYVERQRQALTHRIRDRVRLDATKRVEFDKAPPRTAAQWLRFAHPTEQKALDELAKRLKAVETRPLPDVPRAYVFMEKGPTAPATLVLRRGNPNLTGAEVAPGFPAAFTRRAPDGPNPLSHSTGRRLWLAKWLTSPENPLTARVIVNRLWQWHFGVGLVATPSDFGLNGERPTHPELLDWLACELIESGWRLEHVHRLILHSAAYRTSSAVTNADSTKRLGLFLRWRQRRLDAESVRDSFLAVAGALRRQMHGPGVYPPLPAAVLATQSRPGLGWGKADDSHANRRSIYVHAKRTLRPPELELLDAADSNASCESRPASTTAPQALTFLNGAFAHEQAQRFADRLMAEADTAPARIDRAFRLALARPPRPDEVAAVTAFLQKQPLSSFCLVLLNTSEFFHLD